MTQTYWKWPETSFTSAEIDWKKAEKITAGVDVGTTGTQAAVLCDGALFGYANIHTGVDFKMAATVAIMNAVGDSGMVLKDIGAIVATGWGAKNATFATKTENEVHCHAKGGRFMFGPDVHTVVDLGGQSVAAMRLYDWDRVWDFFMNEKCATGMGRNVETICNLLQVPIEDIGDLSLDVPSDPEPVSTTCYNFAGAETLGLFGRPEYRASPLTENQIYAAYLFAIATRATTTIGRLAPLDVGDLSVYKELGFTGGLAKNKGVTKRIERYFNVTALTSEYDPQIAGAIGAALLA
ncbi:MAG: acyl-CoA dehydratase activase [Peptococcaceae bacterium]|jgi:predicted CoA-substrate-specific enzyme activase|nr:acyl-CoA dehydratase activase [Peptococcaceae bacterium]